MYRSGKAAAAQAGTLDILPVALLTLCPGTVCLAWAHLRKGVCVPCRRIPLRCLRSYVLGTLALPAEAVSGWWATQRWGLRAGQAHTWGSVSQGLSPGGPWRPSLAPNSPPILPVYVSL